MHANFWWTPGPRLTSEPRWWYMVWPNLQNMCEHLEFETWEEDEPTYQEHVAWESPAWGKANRKGNKGSSSASGPYGKGSVQRYSGMGTQANIPRAPSSRELRAAFGSPPIQLEVSRVERVVVNVKPTDQVRWVAKCTSGAPPPGARIILSHGSGRFYSAWGLASGAHLASQPIGHDERHAAPDDHGLHVAREGRLQRVPRDGELGDQGVRCGVCDARRDDRGVRELDPPGDWQRLSRPQWASSNASSF